MLQVSAAYNGDGEEHSNPLLAAQAEDRNSTSSEESTSTFTAEPSVAQESDKKV